MRILKYNDKLVEEVGHEDKMNNMKNKIKNILNDTEFWQPQMIIEEKEPFYWRLNPDWVEEKTKAIMKLIEAERKRTIGIIRQVGALENDEEVEKLINIINNSNSL
ncbi:MAG: hypothetical protein GX666_05215 [Tissierellia bacterium]|nr:hypothetical protein [Tissierellia bacterium]